MSADSNLDGRQMELAAAIDEVVGGGQGTFVSCVPGKLAYFEGEDMHAHYICYRPQSTP
jgi:hypothetical protein